MIVIHGLLSWYLGESVIVCSENISMRCYSRINLAAFVIYNSPQSILTSECVVFISDNSVICLAKNF